MNAVQGSWTDTHECWVFKLPKTANSLPHGSQNYEDWFESGGFRKAKTNSEVKNCCYCYSLGAKSIEVCRVM